MPSGWIEYENPEAGLIREVYEETGLKVEITQLLKAEYVGDPHRIDLYYRGKLVSGEFSSSSEVAEYVFFNINHLPVGLPTIQKVFIKDYFKEKD